MNRAGTMANINRIAVRRKSSRKAATAISCTTSVITWTTGFQAFSAEKDYTLIVIINNPNLWVVDSHS
jgi:hypothetical protein